MKPEVAERIGGLSGNLVAEIVVRAGRLSKKKFALATQVPPSHSYKASWRNIPLS